MPVYHRRYIFEMFDKPPGHHAVKMIPITVRKLIRKEVCVDNIVRPKAILLENFSIHFDADGGVFDPIGNTAISFSEAGDELSWGTSNLHTVRGTDVWKNSGQNHLSQKVLVIIRDPFQKRRAQKLFNSRL